MELVYMLHALPTNTYYLSLALPQTGALATSGGRRCFKRGFLLLLQANLHGIYKYA